MRFRLAALALGCGVSLGSTAQAVHTPKPGSAERKAICDAARAFVLKKYATKPLPQPIVFKIEWIAVANGFAAMEAVPVFKNGQYVDTEYLPDVVFNFCFKESASGWQVIADLSRTDVPDANESALIRKRLPSTLPLEVLSPTWRKLLGG